MEFSAVNRRRPSRETPLGPGATKDGCFRRLGYTKKFVARNVAEVGRDSTAATLRAILRATNFGVDTRCNSAITRSIARNIEHRVFGPLYGSQLMLGRSNWSSQVRQRIP